MSPLDWTGPEFLILFALMCFMTWGGCAVLRHAALEPHDDPGDPALLPAEVACLAGAERVGPALVAGLHARGALPLEPGGRVGWAPKDANPRERELLRRLEGGSLRRAIPLGEALAWEALIPRLRALGLLTDPARLARPVGVTVGLLLPLLVLGVHKVAVGLDRGRPVTLLVLGLVALGGGAVWHLHPRRWRLTGRGQALLARLRERHRALETTARAGRAESLQGEELTLAVGLYGAEVLALGGSPFAALHDQLGLPPPAPAGSSDGGGCGSAGGCGGGGGGCGGGCGGCGG